MIELAEQWPEARLESCTPKCACHNMRLDAHPWARRAADDHRKEVAWGNAFELRTCASYARPSHCQLSR